MTPAGRAGIYRPFTLGRKYGSDYNCRGFGDDHYHATYGFCRLYSITRRAPGNSRATI